jgi:hypothetical protein
MTILNVAISEDRALLATNTEGVGALDERSSRCGKIFVLPQLNAVIAGRGQLAALFNVYIDAYAGFHKGIEAVAAAMPAVIQRRVAMLAAELAGTGVEPDIQVALVGWSAARNRMVGWVYTAGEVIDLVGHGGCVSPWDAAWGETPAVPLSPDPMHVLAGDQAERAECSLPGGAWGGDVLFAEVARDYVMTSVRPMG